MKLSKLVEELKKLDYEYFHRLRKEGNVPEEPEIYIQSIEGGFTKDFKLDLDMENGISLFEVR